MEMDRAFECTLKVGQVLGQSHKVCGILGDGSYGYVAKCINIKTGEMEAIKVSKSHPVVFHQARKEIAILKQLLCLDPDTSNIVRWNGFFFHEENICLNFELLDQSLHEYMDSYSLPMTEIRSILHQLATALLHLKSKGIIHADVKPYNIMVEDRDKHPARVKLIDFGLAHPVSAAKYDRSLQTTWYRAPEVILGIPYNEAIDIWSLGLVAVEMATGFALYSGNSNYDVIRFITETQGQPPDYLLDRGVWTDKYFNKESNGQRVWRLKTPDNETSDSEDTRLIEINCLDELVELIDTYGEDNRDQLLLVDLIKGMLQLDPDLRLKPHEILQHPFITNSPKSSHANNVIDITYNVARTVGRQRSWYPTPRSENNHCMDNGTTEYDGPSVGQSHKLVEVLGEGTYGLVSKCINIKTDKMEAIKLFKKHTDSVYFARMEIDILKQLRCLDPDTCNIIKWNGFFFHDEDICLNFELLDQSLEHYLDERNKGLPMTEIRSIIHQLATALAHLRSMEIIHADIKPGNVMVVDPHQHPMKVKVIDFGLAHLAFPIRPGEILQTLWYRAPEITLHIPYTEAIDMWSVGVLAVELATGWPLYPANTEYELLSFIVNMQGQPPDHVLDRGAMTSQYFDKESNGQGWRFETGQQFASLDDLLMHTVIDEAHETDHLLLLDLIKKMLHLDPEQRIKPLEVLQHPFMANGLPNSPRPYTGPESIQCNDESQAASLENAGDVQHESKAESDGFFKTLIGRIKGTFCNFFHRRS